MSEYLASVPYSVSIAVGLLGVGLWLKACDLIGRYLASRTQEPEIDYVALQAEMDEEFAPLSRSRREEYAARLQ